MNIDIIKQRLRQEIKTSNKSIKEIAELLGISPEMVTQYCTTKKLPRLDTFAKLCEILEVSADYILGIEK
ncbi:MAG: helix-turn-helix transcriptional regulator [Clostridia bacterium]|nr:helix-turn-helix transcriptional regulator [Clostridia bacterium]